MEQSGMLVILSGFSGAGKGTLMKALMRTYDNYALSVSATTRKPREGEQDGREYFFLDEARFERMIQEDALIEYARYVDNYYGTPKEYVLGEMAAGRDVILEIEIQGALKVKEKFPDAILIFVMPPSAGELRRRLVGRGTESLEVINARLERAAQESEEMTSYEFIIINDELDACVRQLHQLIQSQHQKVSHNRRFIDQIRQELQEFRQR